MVCVTVILHGASHIQVTHESPRKYGWQEAYQFKKVGTYGHYKRGRAKVTEMDEETRTAS